MEAITPVKNTRRALGDLTVNTTFATPSSRWKVLVKSDHEPVDSAKPGLERSAQRVGTARKRSIGEVIGCAVRDEPRSCPARQARVVDVFEESTSVAIDPKRSPSDASRSSESVRTVRAWPQPDILSREVSVVSEPERSPATMAETLKLRLQLAMYKVDTGQEHVPFDRLQMFPRHDLVRTISASHRQAALHLRSLSQDQSQCSTRSHSRRPSVQITSSPPELISPLAADGDDERGYGGKRGYPGRPIYYEEADSDREDMDGPAAPRERADGINEEAIVIPDTPPPRSSQPAIAAGQRTSPAEPRSANRVVAEEESDSEDEKREVRLTSSIVKGRAAASWLLQLSRPYT